MKKLILLLLLTALMLLGGSLLAHAQAQNPPNDLKPTFISPTPGLYVNGWPAFTSKETSDEYKSEGAYEEHRTGPKG